MARDGEHEQDRTIGSLSSHEGPRAPNVVQPFTPQSYAKAVRNFSRLPMGTGQNHERLARFLSSLITNPSDQIPTHEEHFVTKYTFRLSLDPVSSSGGLQVPQSRRPTVSAPKWDMEEAKHLQSRRDYAQLELPRGPDLPGQIFFLRGFPTPEWIGLIGSIQRVDPEFFSRWLDFRSPDDRTNNFSFPSLPSDGWNLIELPIVSIGSKGSVAPFERQESLNAARADSAAALRSYLDDLNRNIGTPLGSSVVRDICLFDDFHFALEQRITICLQPQEGPHGWTLLVWMDSGETNSNSLLDKPWVSPPRTLGPRGCYLWPITRYRPNMGLNAHLLSKGEPESTTKQPSPTASAMHLNYGRSLRPNVMASDPFYALSEVFSLAAASEKQFLNLVEHKLSRYMDLNDDNFEALPNIKYIKQILLRHIRQIQNVRLSIQNCKHPKWPKSTSDVGRRARGTVEWDYAHLDEHAQTLSKRCQEAIMDLRSSAQILESEKQIHQAERVGKLTFLAFIYVPLAFTTSFFSMDIVGIGGHKIWVWIAMTAPVMLLTLLAFFYDVVGLWRRSVRFANDKIYPSILR